MRVARYAAKLEKNATEVSLNTAELGILSLEQLAGLPVQALRLERPGDEPARLTQRFTQDVPAGAWPFQPDTREPGNWLIYPAEDAALSFRPTRWTVVGGTHTDSPLTRAIGLSNQAARDASLDEAIDAMSSDFLAPCWTELEQIAGQIGHLPLTTLDMWRRLARCPYGMAALAFRLGTLPGGFLARFAQELPFAWEAIPFVAWKQAIEALKAQCELGYDGEAGGLIFKNHLDSVIKNLSAMHGALHYLLGIANADYNPEAKRNANALRYSGDLAGKDLFNGENSLHMRLRQSHAEETWPDGARSILAQGRNQPGKAKFLNPEKLGYPDGVINLPLLLAAQVATNTTADWFARADYLHILRTHRAFDPDWFDEAYNLTIARCLAAGLLDN